MPLSYDPWILIVVLLLVGLGLVMVYSSSAVTAQEKLGDGFHYLKRQGIAACIGFLAMAPAMRPGGPRTARAGWPPPLFLPGLFFAGAFSRIRVGGEGARTGVR